MSVPPDDESDWRFGVDDVDEDGVVEPDAPPIEPEAIDAENVLFVLVGVVGAVLLLVGGV